MLAEAAFHGFLTCRRRETHATEVNDLRYHLFQEQLLAHPEWDVTAGRDLSLRSCPRECRPATNKVCGVGKDARNRRKASRIVSERPGRGVLSL